jgi:hypothetical protein
VIDTLRQRATNLRFIVHFDNVQNVVKVDNELFPPSSTALNLFKRVFSVEHESRLALSCLLAKGENQFDFITKSLNLAKQINV